MACNDGLGGGSCGVGSLSAGPSGFGMGTATEALTRREECSGGLGIGGISTQHLTAAGRAGGEQPKRLHAIAAIKRGFTSLEPETRCHRHTHWQP